MGKIGKIRGKTTEKREADQQNAKMHKCTNGQNPHPERYTAQKDAGATSEKCRASEIRAHRG
jgi:hypothetical protein